MIRPLAFTWPYAIAFWVVFFWSFAPEFGVVGKASRKSDKDAGSLIVILLSNQIAMFVGFLSTWVFRWAAMPFPFVMYWVGIAILFCGSLLRRYCFRILGKFFDGAVNIREDHKVIDFGPYRWVRHPAYTGGMLMFFGIGVALGNWVSVAVLVLLPVFAYSYRVRVEERALVASLGEPYAAYMRTHKRFIPYVV